MRRYCVTVPRLRAWAIKNGLGRYYQRHDILDGCGFVLWGTGPHAATLYPNPRMASAAMRRLQAEVDPSGDPLVDRLTVVQVPWERGL